MISVIQFVQETVQFFFFCIFGSGGWSQIQPASASQLFEGVQMLLIKTRTNLQQLQTLYLRNQVSGFLCVALAILELTL